MQRLIPAFAALLLVAAAAHAQNPSAGDAPRPPRARAQNCAQAPDPAACEARRQERREAFRAAADACKDKAAGPERRACMTKQLCAKAQDAAQCEQRAAQRAARRRAAPPQQ
jgi:hypothetical protein